MDQINATTTENEWINQTAMERDTGACPPGSETYRVQRGDSFYLIARKFGVSVRALMNANPNIAAGHLLVGDILCVPVGEGRSCPVGSSAYTVRPGQSVVDVMLSSNVSLRALREYNEDIRLTALRPGDVLVVPYTTNELLPYIRQAAAVITEEASAECHTATIGLALDKPVIVGAAGAVQRLTDGTMVTVDCARGLVRAMP